MRTRPGRAAYWPDRSAVRRRRNARRVFWVAVALVLVLPWFGYRHVREWLRPGVDAPAAAVAAPAVEGPPAAPRRVTPVSPATVQGVGPSLVAAAPGEDAPEAGDATADGVDAIGREARAGDADAAVAKLADIGAEVHRQALLADRGSAIRREAARRDVAEIAGVRAAGWVDRMTVLLVMSSRGGGHSAIADACRRLSAHGDVTGLAVRVQEVAGDDVAAGALLGECRPGMASTAPASALQPFPGTPLRATADLRALVPAGEPEDDEAAAERRKRAEESLRILSESTPELPAAPQPRADPDAR